MNRLILTAVMLLASAALGYAQFDSEPKYDAGSVSALVDRVHTDLNNAYSRFHFSNGDRDRLNKAEKELREFSQKWQGGKFDKGQLDGAIASIQHVLDDNKMSHDERNAIDDDISQLRKMREAYNRHEIEGAHR
jgi:hypothetical protein